jgi:hypothetical protein
VVAFAAPQTQRKHKSGRRAVFVQASAGSAKPWKKKDCRLVLEDGSVWWGVSFGRKGTEVGEVGLQSRGQNTLLSPQLLASSCCCEHLDKLISPSRPFSCSKVLGQKSRLAHVTDPVPSDNRRSSSTLA